MSYGDYFSQPIASGHLRSHVGNNGSDGNCDGVPVMTGFGPVREMVRPGEGSLAGPVGAMVRMWESRSGSSWNPTAGTGDSAQLAVCENGEQFSQDMSCIVWLWLNVTYASVLNKWCQISSITVVE